MTRPGILMTRVRERAILLVLIVGTVGWVTWPLLTAYRLHGDDFSPIFYSSAPYFDIADWPTWFTEGYSEYFINYDGWPALGTDFVRPVVNLAMYAQGMLAPVTGDPAYLVFNYLALLGTALLAHLIIQRYTDAALAARVLAGLAVALSPVWYPDLTEASFSTNALACFFATAAVAVLDAPSGVPRGARLWTCVTLQVLAVWSHETAVVVPFVCLALLYAFAPKKPALRQAALFAVPLLAFVAARLLITAEGGVYALRSAPLTSALKRLGGYVFGPPIPFDMGRLGAMLAGSESAVTAVAYVLAVVANVAVIASVVLSLPERPKGSRFWALLAAVALSRLPGALVRMEPRFLGFALVVTLVAFFTLTQKGRGRAWRNAVAVLLVVSQAAMLYSEVYTTREDTIRSMERAGDFFDSARRSIADASPDTVVLVNDNVGYYSARAMIEMAAWPSTGLSVVVVNSFEGEPSPESDTQLTVRGRTLIVDTSFADGQRAFFAGALPDFERPANGLSYTQVVGAAGPHAAGFRASGRVDADRMLLLGIDPRDGSLLEPVAY